jgi:predicted RNase H-like HicB family nuclease
MRQIIIHPDETGGFYAECPSLPGCVSEGETVEETIVNMKEAIELYIESLEAHGEPVPEDTDVQIIRI